MRRAALALVAAALLAAPAAAEGPLPPPLDRVDVGRVTDHPGPCGDAVDCLIAGLPLPPEQEERLRATWASAKEIVCTQTSPTDPRAGVSVDGSACRSVGPRDFVPGSGRGFAHLP